MKIALLLVLVLLGACSASDGERVKQENLALKAQLESLTSERDALKAQLEAIRAALTTPADTTTHPDTSGTDSSSDVSAQGTSSDVSAQGTNSDVSGTDSSLETPATPNSATPAPVTASPAFEYAKSVLGAAQTLRERGQTPPSDCASGYTAGSVGVGPSPSIKRCEVKLEGDALSVRVETLDGSVITAQ